MFFVFNLYARRLSYTEDTLHHLLHYLKGKFRGNFPWLCSGLFSFAACFFLFTDSIFYFAAGISLLPWPISFCPRAFFFCRDYLSFAAKIYFLLREFFFCRKLFSFAVTLVGHRSLAILKKNELSCDTEEENMNSTDSALNEIVSSCLHEFLSVFTRFSISVGLFFTY